MKRYGLNELREMFLSFFEEKEHLRLPGFSLVPRGDASLLLINSGMAPMKTWFTGEQKPPCKRVCTCQKCIRTGDIDSVGKTSRHGTYFEMLGNFSFGDYFKHDAIVWCWEFLTKRLGIDPDLLYPSVYIEDEQAFDIWRDAVKIPPERIVKLGKEDNFWDHGSGPCGPCSEVYFDRGERYGCDNPDCSPGCSCDRYVEVWNNVFTQFSNDGQGNYSELTQKNIDTGLGLERLACVCQGVDSIFEIDTIRSIVDKVSQISGTAYGKNYDSDVSIRIITDHIRASTMMIGDGILPSNEGRGYVLRRLLRRAARHGRLLGINNVFLGEICQTVIQNSQCAYPDLAEKSDYIKRIIAAEEESFSKTIDAGISMLTAFISKLKNDGKTVLSGTDAFKLYDTFGFPLDLTVDILAEHGMTADTDDFDKKMNEQRTRARKAREALGDLAWESIDLGLDDTKTEFTGYDSSCCEAVVLAIVSQGELCAALSDGEEGYIVLDKTPFYAQMGGQSADTGTLSSGGNSYDVIDVQVNKTDTYLHHGKMQRGIIKVGDKINAQINTERRGAIKRAHSATHLLHHALREVLGSHVNQAGSLVEQDKLRFDFTHTSSLSDTELEQVERKVNAAALSGSPVVIRQMPIDEAKALGAAALFGEKYGDIVRVVSMGDSVELCGGTHVDNTAAVGMFTITSEFSVASGVRRIEALTGLNTFEMLKTSRRHLSEIASLLKVNSTEEISGKIEQNLSALRTMRSALESTQSKQSDDEARRLLESAEDIGGHRVITAVFDDASATVDKLKQMTDTLRDIDSGVVAVLAVNKDGKLTILAACGKDSIGKGITAGELVRNVTSVCGGSGGGKPDFAMGGGRDIGKLKEALESVGEYVRGRLEV